MSTLRCSPPPAALRPGRGTSESDARPQQGSHHRSHQPHRRSEQCRGGAAPSHELRPQEIGRRVSRARTSPSSMAAPGGRPRPWSSIPDAVSRTLRRPSAPYLFRMGLMRPKDTEPAALANPETRERVSQVLYAMSGMPASMKRSRRSSTQPADVLVEPHLTLLCGYVAACESAAKSELQIMLANKANRGAPLLSFRPIRRSAISSSRSRQTSRHRHERSKRNCSASSRRRKSGSAACSWPPSTSYAARERDVLVDALSRGSSPRVWTHEGVGSAGRWPTTGAAAFKSPRPA